MDYLTTAALFGGFLYVFYRFCTSNYSRFEGTNVPFLKPSPLVGNLGRYVLRVENRVLTVERIYKAFPKHRFTGLFNMRSANILIRDPDLIRQIGIKDFDSFVNHRMFLDAELDPLIGQNLFLLQDKKWRDMRATVSPAFTGSKMRNMYTLLADCALQMSSYLKKETQGKGETVLELKDIFSRCTNNFIATAAFGLKVDSLEDRENQFYRMAKKLTHLSGLLVTLKFLGVMLMPKLMKLLRIRFIEESCSRFIHELVHDTMALREREGIVRPDMIHLLMQARKGQLQYEAAATNKEEKDAGFATAIESEVGRTQNEKRVWSDMDLSAQAAFFLLGGSETTSLSLSSASYELAINPDVQTRLQTEIDEVCRTLGDKKSPEYDEINRMKYLDMVVTESLRLWPPIGTLDRVCTKPYILEDHEGNKFEIKKGEVVVFPNYSLQHDEKYYPDPEKFDPERFSDENKKNIKPFTYMPFGVGPRNCIGSRFALMEIKSILFNILRDFDLVPCEKTQIPLELSKKSLQMQAKEGYWISIKPRT